MPGDLQRGGGNPEATGIETFVLYAPSRCSPADAGNPNLSQLPSSSLTTTSPNFPTSSNSYDFSDVKLALSVENHQTRQNVLGDAVFFPEWRDDAANAGLDHPDEMQKKDPLGTQIWKLYSRTKTQLPNQERLENLTWRMMAMNLRRKEQERARSVASKVIAAQCIHAASLTCARGRMAQQTTSAPSGIAKLRHSQDPTHTPDPDPMNLDDYIVPSSMASPAGIATPSPPTGHTTAHSNAVSPAIPIKTKKELEKPPHPSFAPSAPSHDRSRAREFGYVQRRVRKTSIDETKVRLLGLRECKVRTKLICPFNRIENDPPNFPHKSLLQMVSPCPTRMPIKVWRTTVLIRPVRALPTQCMPIAILRFRSTLKLSG